MPTSEISLDIGANSKKALAEVAALKKTIEKTQVNIRVGVSRASITKGAIRKQVSKPIQEVLNKERFKIKVDVDRRSVGALASKINKELADKKIQLKARADTQEAKARINDMKTEARRGVDFDVEANTAGAHGEIQSLRTFAQRDLDLNIDANFDKVRRNIEMQTKQARRFVDREMGEAISNIRDRGRPSPQMELDFDAPSGGGTTSVGDVPKVSKLNRVKSAIGEVGESFKRARRPIQGWTGDLNQGISTAIPFNQQVRVLRRRIRATHRPFESLRVLFQSTVAQAKHVRAAFAALSDPNLLSIVSGIVGLAGFTAAAGGAAAAAGVAEFRFAQLKNQAQAMGGTIGGMTMNEVESFVRTLESRFVPAAQSVRQAIAIIGRNTNLVGDDFKTANVLAQNLAATFEIDLPSAAETVAEIFQDPASAMESLREAGVKIRPQLQEQIQLLAEQGDTARASSLLVEKAFERTKGNARDLAETTGGLFSRLATDIVGFFRRSAEAGGVLDALKDDIETLRELFRGATNDGRFFKDIIQAIGNTAIFLVRNFSPIMDIFTVLVTGKLLRIAGRMFLNIGAGLATAAVAGGTFGKALRIITRSGLTSTRTMIALLAVVGSLASKFRRLGSIGLTVAVGSLVAFRDEEIKLRDQTVELSDVIETTFGTIGTVVSKALGNFDSLAEKAKKHGKTIAEAFGTTMLKQIKQSVQQIIDLFELVVALAANMPDIIKNAPAVLAAAGVSSTAEFFGLAPEGATTGLDVIDRVLKEAIAGDPASFDVVGQDKGFLDDIIDDALGDAVAGNRPQPGDPGGASKGVPSIPRDLKDFMNRMEKGNLIPTSLDNTVEGLAAIETGLADSATAGNTFKEALEEVNFELEQVGRSDRQRFIEQRMRRFKEGLDESVELTSDQLQTLRDKFGTLFDKQRVRENAESARDQIQTIMDRGAENIQDTFANTFADIFRNGVDGFDGFFDRIKDIAIDTAAQIAAAFAQEFLGINKLVADVTGILTGKKSMSALGTGGGVVQDVLGSIGIGGPPGSKVSGGGGIVGSIKSGVVDSISSVLGLGETGSLTQQLGAKLGFQGDITSIAAEKGVAPAASGRFGGTLGGAVSGVLGAAGGALGGMSIGDLIGSRVGGGAGAQIGGGIGGAAGSVFGPLGSIAGSAIGGTIGSGADRLFNADSTFGKIAGGLDVVFPGVGSVISEIGSAFGLGGDSEDARVAIRTLSKQNQQEGFKGKGMESPFGLVGFSPPGGATGGTDIAGSGLKLHDLNKFARSLADIDERIADFLTEAQAGDVKSALQEQKDFSRATIRGGGKRVFSQFIAERFGVVFEAIGEEIPEAIRQIETGDIKRSVEETIKAGLEPLKEIVQERFEDLSSALQSTAQSLMERRRLIEDTQTGINDLLANMIGSPDSPLAPRTRLANARQQFEQTLAGARAGRPEALRSVTSDAQNFLDISRNLFASSPEFFERFRFVQQALSGVDASLEKDQQRIDETLDNLSISIERGNQQNNKRLDALIEQAENQNQRLEELTQEFERLTEGSQTNET